jgi:hypothetical protein
MNDQWPMMSILLKKLFFIVMIPWIGVLNAQGQVINQSSQNSNSEVNICQYRHFVINRGKMDEFIEAWENGVYPLRLRFDFTIPVYWSIPETNQFIWLICYDGDNGFESQDKAYYESDERKNLVPDPVPYIASYQRWFVESVQIDP